MTSLIDATLYSVLRTVPDATPKQLRAAYLSLLVTAHPDKGGDAERFQAIQRAYAVLSDPYERAVYDEKQTSNNKPLGATTRLEQRGGGVITSSSSNGGVNKRKVTVRNGVTAVVHGETRPVGSHQEQDAKPTTTAATAGGSNGSNEYYYECGDDIKEVTLQLHSLTAAISELLLLEEQNQGTRGHEHERQLAELHAQRAVVHLKLGRLHHAAFDAQEALDLWPGSKEGIEVLEQVQQLELQQQLEEEEELVGEVGSEKTFDDKA